MITGTGTFLKNQAELIKIYCGSNLKQYMAEHDSMRELFKEREVVRGAYVRKEQDLIYKKEKLFKIKNPSKWGCTNVTEDELV